MKVTELEQKSLRRYADELMKLAKKKVWFPDEMIGILNSMRAYQLSLFVKYDVDVYEYDICNNSGEFVPHEENKK